MNFIFKMAFIRRFKDHGNITAIGTGVAAFHDTPINSILPHEPFKIKTFSVSYARQLLLTECWAFFNLQKYKAKRMHLDQQSAYTSRAFVACK
jgi:hypothetical protein